MNHMQGKTSATEAEIATALDVARNRPGAGEPVYDAMSTAIDEALDRLGDDAVLDVSEKLEQACDDCLAKAEGVVR